MSNFWDRSRIENMEDNEYAELRNCKKHLEKYFCSDISFGEYESQCCGSVKNWYVPLIGSCVDNFRLEVKFDETDFTDFYEYKPADIIKSIDLNIGGIVFDTFDMYSLDIELMKRKLVCERIENKLTIPIPFDITSGNNVLWLNFFHKENYHERNIVVRFNKKNKFSAKIVGSFYGCGDVVDFFDIKKEISVDFINIYKARQHNIINFNDCNKDDCNKYEIFFEACCKDIYFFIVGDNDEIVREKMFDNFNLYFNDKIVDDYVEEESLGITWIKFNKFYNMSKCANMYIELNKNKIENEKFKLCVYAITENFIVYAYGLVCNGRTTEKIIPHYFNSKKSIQKKAK